NNTPNITPKPKRLHRRHSSALNTHIQIHHHPSHTRKHSRRASVSYNPSHKNNYFSMIVGMMSRRGLWVRVLAVVTVLLLILWVSLPNEMGKKSLHGLKGWESEASTEQQIGRLLILAVAPYYQCR